MHLLGDGSGGGASGAGSVEGSMGGAGYGESGESGASGVLGVGASAAAGFGHEAGATLAFTTGSVASTSSYEGTREDHKRNSFIRKSSNAQGKAKEKKGPVLQLDSQEW